MDVSPSLVHFLTGLFAMLVLLLQVSADDPALRCLVCRKLSFEIETAISKVNPKKMVEVGSYRIQPDGSQKRMEVPYARSEIHLGEVLEKVCDSMEDYVQATYKDSGERTLVKLVTEGGMNPEVGLVNITPDEDLNKMVKFYCENVVEDNEDNIMKIYKDNVKDPEFELCTGLAGVCQDDPEDETDTAEKDEL